MHLPPSMKGMIALVVSIMLIVVLWLVGPAFGFEISLLGSLGLTIGLTLILNVVLGALSQRQFRRYQ